ncbi:MAG: hypothetical protein Q9178_002745 [Gyalolechia marmorata]
MAQGPSPHPPPPPPPDSDKTQKTSDIIGTLRPTKLFKLSKPDTYVTSLDFDDEGLLLIAACSDSSLQLYSAQDGTHRKTLLSQKYGCHLARFSHHSESVIYASTKVDDTLRYLSTHDNSYIRYFKGHSGAVTDLALSPRDDTFLSCSADNTVRLWSLKSQYAQARLNLATPYLAAYDPSATVIAVASASTSSILLYDVRNYDKPPFATFDMRQYDPPPAAGGMNIPEWTKLEFSNDGKSLLVTTNHVQGHLLLDAFNGELKAHLPRPYQPTWGILRSAPSITPTKSPLGQGDTSFSPDGRYVVGSSGADRDAVVWDTQGRVSKEGERKLEASADLARTCRTCRVFHYMTLPQLYTNVTLRSYDSIRYSSEHGRVEGSGMGSPFVMGLNGLVLRNVAGYVRRLELVGEWKEDNLEECSKRGRVPDSSIILNTLVRVAIERATNLRDLCWELNTKMLPTIWQALKLSNIKSLTLKFPSSRDPRPIMIVPPLQSLVALRVLNVDPLCYVDDISLLLAESKRLRDLTIVWSPRMREVKEPSVNLSTMFGRTQAKGQPLKLNKVAIKNLFTYAGDSCQGYYDHSALQELTIINSTGGLGDAGAAAFVDSPCREAGPPLQSLKSIRMDKISRELQVLLANSRGLEKLYIFGGKKAAKHESPNAFPRSPASNGSSSPSDLHSDNLRDDTIEAIAQNHGQTLRHLLLPPQWRLTSDNIALIVHNCPNLEQLGLGAEFDRFISMRLLMPFLPKLIALRVLDNPDSTEFRDKMHELDDGRHEKHIGGTTSVRGWSKMRWMELAGLLFEVGTTELMEEEEMPGKMSYRRKVWKRDAEAVKDIDIWRLDSLDV